MRGELFSFAVRNLRDKQLRSWLTIVGIIIGIASIVTLVLIGNGLENAIKEQFSKLGVSSIRVVPGNLKGPPAGNIGFNNSIIDIVEGVKSIDYVNPILLNFATVEYANEEDIFMTVGYDTELSDKGFVDIDVKLKEGRFFNHDEKGGVIIGYNIATDEFKKDIVSKNTIKLNDAQFKVIGIFEKTGTDVDDRIYLPLDDARDLFDKKDIVNVLTVKIKEGIEINDAAEDVKRRLLRSYEEEQFVVYTPEQLLAQLNDILKVITFLLSGIAAISLVVGGIGIMNSMFTSVLEKRRDIGIMKSIGATNKQILALFLVESGLIGFVGGAIGVLIGVVIAKSVEAVASSLGFGLLSISLNLDIMVAMLLFSFVIGMASGFIPAYQAARLKPVEALRYE